MLSRLHQLITNAWEVGSVPQAWKDASIVTITKKGDRDCGNYRGMSLLFIASKIFARILLNRLSTHITPEVVPETQCGFRGNQSTVDMIFCLRQLQEQCIEQDRPLYMVFVEFSKAFDTVWMPREVHNYNRGSTCTGSHPLLHLPISNAGRGIPRYWGWRLRTVQTER